MAALIVIALALAALAYSLRPLFRPPQNPTAMPETDAEVRKLRALEGIVDLEADRAAGKISAEDFERFKESYARDAVLAMRELDVAAHSREDRDLEAEIAAARDRLR